MSRRFRITLVWMVFVACSAAGCSNTEAEKAKAEAAEAEAVGTARVEAAEAETALAKGEAAAERLARLRQEAPSKVSARGTGCVCAPGKTIAVSCTVTNSAEVAVDVRLEASAETGSMGVDSSGTATLDQLGPGQSFVAEIPTHFSALADCSSCKSAACKVTQVVAR